jgi:hypothetical protein
MQTSRNAGIALLETLGYIAILGVLINLALSTFVSAGRLTSLGNAARSRIEGISELDRGFRGAVREAVGTEVRAGVYEASETVLVLRLPDGPNGERRHTVVGDLRGTGRLARVTFSENGSESRIESATTYTPMILKHGFKQAGNGRLITLTVTIDNAGFANTIPAENTFVASMRAAGAQP